MELSSDSSQTKSPTGLTAALSGTHRNDSSQTKSPTGLTAALSGTHRNDSSQTKSPTGLTAALSGTHRNDSSQTKSPTGLIISSSANGLPGEGALHRVSQYFESTNTHRIKNSGYATWFTAGGAIRIAHYDVIDDVITRRL